MQEKVNFKEEKGNSTGKENFIGNFCKRNKVAKKVRKRVSWIWQVL